MIELANETFDKDERGRMRINRRYLAESRSEALGGIPAVVDGLPLVGTRGRIWISQTDGRHVIDAVYEGMTEDPPESADEYELITEEREQKIEAFRPRGVLLEDYGGYYDPETGDLLFPPTMPRPANRLGRPLTLDTMRGDDDTPNPLWGAKSYPVPHTVAVWRLSRMRVPQALVKQEGTVIDRLPAGFDYTGPKKQWYVRPLQKRRRGNCWDLEWTAMQVTEFADQEVLLALRAAENSR